LKLIPIPYEVRQNIGGVILANDLEYGDSLALTAQLEEVSKLLEAYIRELLKAE
jgi:hypothetical protein